VSHVHIETCHWQLSQPNSQYEQMMAHPHIQEAASYIRAGELVAFPTETVYGLGADATCDEAVQRIFKAKGRPSDNPLIVHLSSITDLQGVVAQVSSKAEKLIEAFWPGPLTLLLPKGKQVCDTVTAGLSTVAVRMPAHPVALALIAAAKKPLAAPSANLSGKPSPTTADHVLDDLKGRIRGVLDAGTTGIGLESTVVDVTLDIPMILRPGGITLAQLQAVVGEVKLDPMMQREDHDEASRQEIMKPRSPGMKYRHYAPSGDLWLVSCEKGLSVMRNRMMQEAEEARKQGYRVGILTTDDGLSLFTAERVISLGKREALEQIASQLYAALRQCDQGDLDRIYAETFPKQGLGEAIMNRLEKASEYKPIRV